MQATRPGVGAGSLVSLAGGHVCCDLPSIVVGFLGLALTNLPKTNPDSSFTNHLAHLRGYQNKKVGTERMSKWNCLDFTLDPSSRAQS